MMLSQDLFTANRGIRRSPDDQRRGAVIEALLCQGRATLDADLLAEAAPTLRAFVDRGLATLDGDACTILPAGLPYARTIAAQFDPYRKDSQRRFSSAV